MEIHNFAEAHQALRKYYGKHTTAPYTLNRMRELMNYLGNPQDELQVIHVAGTSGKTSTAYYITSLLNQAGYTVGLTVSPHVDEVNERVQIDGVPLVGAEFCAALSEFLVIVEHSAILPSYFECMVAFAYWEFARRKVDYAVVEVGLGGLLDGTNVVNRPDKICVITDIGLDHTEILGDTLEKIAAQKAGIIQPGNEVYIAAQNGSILDVVESTCQRQGAELHIVETADLVPLGNLPGFQRRNFELADEVVDFVLRSQDRPRLTEAQLRSASQVYIPARMEVVKVGDKDVIIDGAHNAQKLSTLLASVNERYDGEQVAALVGFVAGSQSRTQQALDVLTEHISFALVTEFYTEKDYPKHSVNAAEVQRYCSDIGFTSLDIIPKPEQALEVLLNRPEKVLLVTGSFYLLNHIRPLLHLGR